MLPARSFSGLLPSCSTPNLASSSPFFSSTTHRLLTFRRYSSNLYFFLFNASGHGNRLAFRTAATSGPKHDKESSTRLNFLLKDGRLFGTNQGDSTNSAGKIHNARVHGRRFVSHHEETSTRNSPESLFLAEQSEVRCSQFQFPAAAYVHLPFCRRRCHYCDFPIIPVGELINSPHVSGRMQEYVKLLCKEIVITATSPYARNENRSMTSSLVSGKVDGRDPLKTVFFGGGTPSLISPELLKEVLKCLQDCIGIACDAEISMEMDPGTFDDTKLQGFLDAGVNRVSLGVQSFQARLLKACGRAHGLTEIDSAIRTLRAAGVQNWSMDLISSLPGQSLGDWRDSLAKAIESEPAHISVYDLQIEEGTAFGRWYRPGEGPLPSDEASAEMFQTASMFLQSAGYEHYEISNYAKPGFQCRHNLVYWKNQPYFGFGLGSASYVHSQRFSRPKKIGDYAKWISEYESAGGNIEWPKDGVEDLLLDSLMLGLRLAEGIRISEFRTRFGERTLVEIVHGLLENARLGNVVFVDKGGLMVSPQETFVECESDTVVVNPKVSRIRLSDPKGFMLSNDVIAGLFSTLSRK